MNDIDSYYRVHCSQCGPVQIGRAGYNKQMDRPDDLWRCPNCGLTADFDDDRLEEMYDRGEPTLPAAQDCTSEEAMA